MQHFSISHSVKIHAQIHTHLYYQISHCFSFYTDIWFSLTNTLIHTYSSGAEAGHMYLFNCLSFQLPTFRLQSIFILCLTVVCFSFSWSMWLLLFIYFVLLYWTFKPSAMRTTCRQTGGWADGRTN